ncbi:hypothetical protein D3C85_1268970 [compost metagenome]
MLDEGFHQLLVDRDGAVGHLDGDDVPGRAGLAFVDLAPADAKAREDAFKAGHFAGVPGVHKSELDPLAKERQRLAIETGDVPLPGQQGQ